MKCRRKPLSMQLMATALCFAFSFILCLFPKAALAGDEGEPFYFIAIAKVLPEKRQDFQNFFNKVTPIWQRHGMTTLLQARIFDGVSFGDISDMPSDVALLRVKSREGFQSYLADPEYTAIKHLRLNSVTEFLVLEANAVGDVATTYLNKAPHVAVRFGSEQIMPAPLNINLRVFDRGFVKGPISTFMKSVTNVQFQAVTFDDNPMQYFSNEGAVSLGLLGEIVRP